MPFGWIVLALLTSAAAVAAIGGAIRTAPAGRAELWMVAGLFFFALLATPVVVLGYTQELYAPRLALVSLALFVGVFLVFARGRPLREHLRDVGRAALTLLTLPLAGVREAARARSLVALGLVWCAGMIGYSAWLSYLAPSEGWDALFYHEPITGFALQNHGFAVVDLPPLPMAQIINGYPRACQAIAMWFVIFADRTLIEIGDTLAAPCMVIAAFALVRRHGERVTAMGWGAVTVLVPAMWAQIRSAQIDLEVTFFLFSALYFATRPTYRIRDAALATLALVLLVASKGTGLTLGPPIALVAYARLLFHHARDRRAAALTVAASGSIVIASVTAIWVGRNYLVFHNPIWPVTYDIAPLGVHFRGLINYRDMNPEPPLKELFETIYGLPFAIADDINPRSFGNAVTWLVWPFGALALLALVVTTLRDLVAFRQLGATWNLFVVAALGVLAAKTANSWIHARFLMQPIVTGMMLVAWLGARPRWRRFGEEIVAAAVVLSILPFFWMKGWFGGITDVQVAAMVHRARDERNCMNPDPTNMPYATARLREKELGPGDRVSFTKEQTWIAPLWNFQFSNVVTYAPFDDAAHFLARVAGSKWVVVGGASDARKAIESRPADWELIGDATPHDGTVAFRRR